MKSITLVATLAVFALLSCGAPALEISWSDDLSDIEGVTSVTELEDGTKFTLKVEGGGSNSSLWGTEIYTHDSSLATAAVHSGVISFDGGGTFTVEVLAGQESYEATEANGVSSSSWGSYPKSFRIVK